MMDLQAFADNADNASQLLKAMANKNRLIILCVLLDQELSVSQLNASVPLSQSALSQNLAALRKVNLVKTRREAQTIYYQIQGDQARQVIKTLKDIFCP